MARRRLWQLGAAFLGNGNLAGFLDGRIYQGSSKALCLPGLNCYSCPGALGACPLGALQSALSGTVLRIPFYVLGWLLLMGSGLGASNSAAGDYDITLHDERMTKKYGLDGLRFGDLVAILDADTRYGRTYRTGAVTIGVVIHGDCILAGHGPGVTTLMSSRGRAIEPFIDEHANLADFFLKK